MAQVDRTVQANAEILHWDLWKLDKPLAKAIQKIDRSAVLSLGVPLAVYCGLSLLVMLPLLLPGYILTLDMAFTPNLHMPEQISSSYLFNAVLHYLNLILPADIIQKIMLLEILVLSGLGMHCLMRHIQQSKDGGHEFAQWGAFIAGALYMVNPFTYSRFMAGQYAVLLGYSLLPFFVRSLLRFCAVPTFQRSLTVSIWLTIIGIVSVHTLGLATILSICSLAVFAWRQRHNSRIISTAVSYGLMGVVLFVVASGYWLVPLLNGSSNQGQAINRFSANDQRAFETTGGDTAGKLGNILQLQGFWAEARGQFALPQERLPGWGFVVLGVWILVGVGSKTMWRQHRAMAVLFIGASVAAVVIAIVGTGNMFALAGFREPQKFVGIVALAFALFAGFGTTTLFARAQKRGALLFGSAAVAVLVLPVLWTPTMVWGFSGQLSPRDYPSDWYTINDELNQDTDNFRVLSLPWHLYMSYPFAGRVIVNPSEAFFDKPTITSNELEFKNASPTFPDTEKTLLGIQILPQAASNPRLGETLNEVGIKYILLAKTFDYQNYEYLNTRPDLQLVADTPNLRLYRNMAYGQ